MHLVARFLQYANNVRRAFSRSHTMVGAPTGWNLRPSAPRLRSSARRDTIRHRRTPERRRHLVSLPGTSCRDDSGVDVVLLAGVLVALTISAISCHARSGGSVDRRRYLAGRGRRVLSEVQGAP